MGTQEPWLIILKDNWTDILQESGKSLAAHRDPKALIDKLGSTGEIGTYGTSVYRSPEYRFIRENYVRDLRQAFLSGSGALRSVFEQYFKTAYASGIHSRGVGRSTRDVVQSFTPYDREYIRVMVEEELDYARGFIRDMNQGYGKMPWDQRFMLYVNALDGVYNSGAVAALPETSLLYWTGPVDKKKCLSCEYLMRNSPYLPETLPTTPRAGDTLCGGNCRDVIAVRPATQDQVRALQLTAARDRDRHVDNLNAIAKRRGSSIRIPPPPPRPKPQPLPQTKPPEVHNPSKGETPSFYNKPRKKPMKKPKYDLDKRRKRYQGDSVLPDKDSPVLQEEEVRLYEDCTVEEGLIRAYSAIRSLKNAYSIFRQLRRHRDNIEFSSIYMGIAVQPKGLSGSLLYKAAPIEKMIPWIEVADNIHRKAGQGALPWRFDSLTTFNHEIEAKAPTYGAYSREIGTSVWAADPADVNTIALEVLTPWIVKQSELRDADLSDTATKLRGMDSTEITILAKNIDNKGLSKAAAEYAKANTIGDGILWTYFRKLAGMSESILPAARSKKSMLHAVRIEESRSMNEAMNTKEKAAIASAIALAAAGATIRSYRTIRTVYQMASNLDFTTLFPIITIQPLTVEDEEGREYQPDPMVISGPMYDTLAWLSAANKAHNKMHGDDIRWTMIGFTSDRAQASKYLSNPGQFIPQAGSHWIDNPKDERAISRALIGKLPPESLHPELRSRIVPRRVRQGERGVTYSTKKAKSKAAEGKVHGYHSWQGND